MLDDLVGSWRLEARDGNFSSFLSCRQVGWFLRTLMVNTRVDMDYALSEDRDTLVKTTRSGLKTSVYEMPTEGDFIPAKTLSGQPEVGRLMLTSGGKLVQEMRFLETDEVAATISHQVVDGKLHVALQCRDIVCNSVYSRMQQ